MPDTRKSGSMAVLQLRLLLLLVLVSAAGTVGVAKRRFPCSHDQVRVLSNTTMHVSLYYDQQYETAIESIAFNRSAVEYLTEQMRLVVRSMNQIVEEMSGPGMREYYIQSFRIQLHGITRVEHADFTHMRDAQQWIATHPDRDKNTMSILMTGSKKYEQWTTIEEWNQWYGSAGKPDHCSGTAAIRRFPRGESNRGIDARNYWPKGTAADIAHHIGLLMSVQVDDGFAYCHIPDEDSLDTVAQNCYEQQGLCYCAMGPRKGRIVPYFSDTSAQQLRHQRFAACPAAPSKPVIPLCGNGIIEGDEKCECTDYKTLDYCWSNCSPDDCQPLAKDKVPGHSSEPATCSDRRKVFGSVLTLAPAPLEHGDDGIKWWVWLIIGIVILVALCVIVLIICSCRRSARDEEQDRSSRSKSPLGSYHYSDPSVRRSGSGYSSKRPSSVSRSSPK